MQQTNTNHQKEETAEDNEKESEPTIMSPPANRAADEVEARNNIQELLKANGMTLEDDKVLFPVDAETAHQGKKKFATYAMSSYSNVMNFFISKKPSGEPKKVGKLLDIVYSTLKTSDDFEGMLKKYPNLKAMHNGKSVMNLDDWARDG
jgi:hypothetical protein